MRYLVLLEGDMNKKVKGHIYIWLLEVEEFICIKLALIFGLIVKYFFLKLSTSQQHYFSKTNVLDVFMELGYN